MNPDDEVVASQLGRPPRGRWRVVARCADGPPLVIAVAPRLEDGSPFPTTFWLTCPRLVEAVHELESAGESARQAFRIGCDPAFAAAVQAADAAYRLARRIESDGADPCEGVGVAGQSDPLSVKCLHARLAAYIAGIPDPIGEAVAAEVAGRMVASCGDARCHACPSAG